MGPRSTLSLPGSQPVFWNPFPPRPQLLGEEHRSQLAAVEPPVQGKKLSRMPPLLCALFTDWLLEPGLYSLFNSASSDESFHLLLQEE